MNNKLKIPLIALGFLWIVSMVGVLLTLDGDEGYLSTSDYNVVMEDGTRCNEEYDGDRLIERNCRSGRNFKSSQGLSTAVSSENNYIQAAHYDFTYSTNGGLKVQDVDYCKNFTGDSMQPTIFEGNVICIKKYRLSMKNQMSEGMIIEYSNRKASSIIHRVKAVYDTHIQVQGDNDNIAETVEYEQVKGVILVVLNK